VNELYEERVVLPGRESGFVEEGEKTGGVSRERVDVSQERPIFYFEEPQALLDSGQLVGEKARGGRLGFRESHNRVDD